MHIDIHIHSTSSPVTSVVDGITILIPLNRTTLTLTVSLEYMNTGPPDCSLDWAVPTACTYKANFSIIIELLNVKKQPQL